MFLTRISTSLAALSQLSLSWESSNEFGPFTSIRLFIGQASGERVPLKMAFPPEKAMAIEGLFAVDVQPALEQTIGNWSYMRLEAKTRNRAGEEFHCYTNAIWVRITGP